MSKMEEGMATNSIFLLEESHGQRSLVGYRQKCCIEPDMTEAT